MELSQHYLEKRMNEEMEETRKEQAKKDFIALMEKHDIQIKPP